LRTLPGADDVALFSSTLVEVLGMHFDESKFGELGKVLQHRLQATSLDCPEYLRRLSTEPGREEVANLARELTVTETYFLRNIEQFNAFIAVALPERAALANGIRPVNILSAGCASGEEPYSIALAIREWQPQLAGAVAITAFDLNPAMLQRAARARYGNWSLRSCPEELKARWFVRDGNDHVLNESIRRAVAFETRNLVHRAPAFWREARFDIIFCRNILMYFSPAQAQAAIARMAQALAPGGYFFLGHAETMRGLSGDFHLCHTHDAFYYQRKDKLGQHEATAESAAESVRMPSWRPLALSGDTSWVEAIARASDRIHALVPPSTSAGSAPLPDAHAASLAAAPAADPDTLLLRAVTASHDGNLDEAEAACRTLLDADDMSAGAHYVLALCSEGRRDYAAALEHDRIAVYLDPGFAMPRLHIGLLTRRHGQRSAARQELEMALTLLQREDPSRLLLFGGGFKRDALIALCRAELAALAAPGADT
jgi:chemotaxis protein methyltransferase CheR